MVCNLDFSEHSDFSNKVSVENKHFLVLRFKYVLAELHECARRRELSLIANKIWFFIQFGQSLVRTPVRLSSAPQKCCQNRVSVAQYHMTSSWAQMLTHRSSRTILKKQEMLTHYMVTSLGKAISVKCYKSKYYLQANYNVIVRLF